MVRYLCRCTLCTPNTDGGAAPAFRPFFPCAQSGKTPSRVRGREGAGASSSGRRPSIKAAKASEDATPVGARAAAYTETTPPPGEEAPLVDVGAAAGATPHPFEVSASRRTAAHHSLLSSACISLECVLQSPLPPRQLQFMATPPPGSGTSGMGAAAPGPSAASAVPPKQLALPADDWTRPPTEEELAAAVRERHVRSPFCEVTVGEGSRKCLEKRTALRAG